MSQEWYLMNDYSRPNSIGGFENEAFIDFKEDAFFETLTTDIADTVTVYNSDLSDGTEIRCIVQNNMPNTMLGSQNREILVPIGTLKTGNYIWFENHYWLITGYPGNNHIFEKATMSICQYKIRWQNRGTGEVIERWVNFSTASKYSIGEYSTDYNTVPNNDFIALIPYDEETILLDDTRVFVDNLPDDPYKVFKLTRNDDPIHNYGEDGAIINFIVDRQAVDPERDNTELRLCDYFVIEEAPPSEDPNVTYIYGHIKGKPELTIGRKKTYTAYFTSVDDLEYPTANVDYRWNIDCDFVEAIKILDWSEADGTLTLLVSDDTYVDDSFKLQLYVNNYFNYEITVTIKDLF